MILKIQFPTINEVNHLVSFVNKYRFENQPKIPLILEVDFSKCNFAKPYHLTCLACLIEGYYINNVQIIFSRCLNSRLCEYLKSLNFFNYWNILKRSNKLPNTKVTTLPLTKLNRSEISAYSDNAQLYFKNNWFKSLSLYPLHLAYSEVLNNTFDHSQSNVGSFTLTQFYPKKNEIVMSVCDLGVGIVGSIKGKENGISTDVAINKAFERGYSIMSSPQNGGIGLDNLRHNVIDSGGQVKIITNDVYITVQNLNKIKKDNLLNDFKGTLLYITLDTSKLDDLSLDDFGLDFEYDF